MQISRSAFLSFCLFLFGSTVYGQANTLADLLTRAEQTSYEETSRHADVLAFVQAVDDASEQIHATTFGYTFEGRAMPLVVVGNVENASPEGVRNSNKTRVFIQANIHAGEVCGKEAMLMLLRDMAGGLHANWLDSLVLLIAPIYNADGNERVKLTNRGRQHGPVAGMGQRPNAQGFDLNRDHMKLDSPEARSLVRLFNEYDPHVIIDLHTTNGTRHGYHLTYAPPLHPNTDPAIDQFLRNEWLPAASQYLQDMEGWASNYYGNATRPNNGIRAWRTFDHRPRFNNNYAGLRNRFAILSEAYSYATFEERVIATLRFVEGAVSFAAQHAGQIRSIVEDVDQMALEGKPLAVSAKPSHTGDIEILMGAVDEVRNPYSGALMLQRRDEVQAETMQDYGSFEATETETVPAAYYIPAAERGVLNKLADHGIIFEQLAEDLTIEVEEFKIDSMSVAAREFQQHKQRSLFGTYIQASRTIPAGSYVARTAQPLGRLLFYLLEPRSDDGLLNWNVLDKSLEHTSVYPIQRSMSNNH